MSRIPLLFALALFLSLNSLVFAQSEEEDFMRAFNSFESSLNGNKKETSNAIDQFEALVKQHPDNPLYLAYLGSAHTLKARDAWMPWTRLRYVERGLDEIDQSLSMLNETHDTVFIRNSILSIETRLVAINTFSQVPGFLNRLDMAADVSQQTFTLEAYNSAPKIVQGRLHLVAAEIAEKQENVEKQAEHLNQAISLLPESIYLTRAQKRLANLRQH